MAVLDLVMLVGSWAGPAPELPPRVRLEWSAPASCPDRAALLEAIDRTLGEVDDEELREVEVRGSLEPTEPDGFVLHLSLDEGRAGARELRGGSCEELSEAAALVIAMAIDPRLLERIQPTSDETPTEPEPEPEGRETADEGTEVPAEPEPEGRETAGEGTEVPAEPAAASPEPSTPAEPQTVTSEPTPPERRPLAFVGRFDGGVGGGPLPGPDAMIAIGSGLAGRGWRAELTASYWPPRSTASPSVPTIGVRMQLWTIGAQGCGEPRLGPVTLPLCAGLRAGAMHAVGTGEQQTQRAASRWLAVVLEPGVVWWARPRLGLALRVSGHAALARPQWRSQPSGVVFEAGAVGGTLRAGLDLRLP